MDYLPNTSPTTDRDDTGRFRPGHNLPGPGRPKRQTEARYLDAVKTAIPPEQIEQLIREALDLARRQNSWRGIVDVLTLALNYGAGKPVNRVTRSDGNVSALLEALGMTGTPGE